MRNREIRSNIEGEIKTLKYELKQINRAIKEFKLYDVVNSWDVIELLKERDNLTSKITALESSLNKLIIKRGK